MIFGFEFLKPEFKLQILVLLQYISHLYYVHDISVDQVFGLVLIFVGSCFRRCLVFSKTPWTMWTLKAACGG